jgi:Tol biopolymer transport system component
MVNFAGMISSNMARMKNSLVIAGLLALCLPAAWCAPASGRIVFSSNRSGAWRIWAMQPDGSQLQQLTKPEGEAQDVGPCFSPDGKEILFTSTRGGTAGVWRMATDGSKARRLCDGDQAEWSRDGKGILFRREERIVTRDLASGKETTLTPADWPHCSGPTYSPDGKSVAFAARWDAGNGVYVVPATGGAPVKVYDKQGACQPHWAPDGTCLVYETETHLCTIHPDGTKNRPLTLFGGVQRYGRYSPDGKMVVFCQGVSEAGPWEIYAVPATGGAPQKLTDGGSDMYPDWK